MGDIEVRDEQGAVVFSIERKTMADWEASIIDGRYKEQKHRLMSMGYRVAYILEGNERSRKKRKRISDAAMRGSLMNTSVRDGLCIIRTTDLADTAKLVTELERRLSKRKIKTGLQVPAFKASKRARMRGPTTILTRQLMCIPSISENIATRLIERFKTREAIVKAAKEEKALVEFKINNRKLGLKAVKNIQQHL